jgi:hypothetical protein
MPISSKRSRTAKSRCNKAHTAFEKRATSAPSPGDSDYGVPDNNSDPSIISVRSSDDEHEGSDIESSVEVLQRFHSVFLPPPLHPEGRTQGKRRMAMNRRPVYTGDSRMTHWRKRAALSLAAEECTTLDRFVVRKVCIERYNVNQASHIRQKRQRSPSPIDVDALTTSEDDPLEVGAVARSTADHANDLPASQLNEESARSVADHAMPQPDIAIDGAEPVLARSVQDLAFPRREAGTAFNDAIDQITEKLAALCLEHLEKNVDSSDGDGSADLNIDAMALEDELKVWVLLH